MILRNPQDEEYGSRGFSGISGDSEGAVMGFILIIGMVIGILVGLAVSTALVIVAAILTRRQSARRSRVWLVFGVVVALLLPILVLVVHAVPLPAVRPGDDYGIAFKNFFATGFGYTAAPGLAALMGWVATFALPKQPMTAKPPRLSP